MESILNNLKTSQLLRISCSDIAAVTGFNPWSKIDELFEKYLYQDLDELMVADAECLDTEFLTTEQEIQKILQKIDTKDKEQFDAIDAVTKDSTVLNNNVKAEDMIKQIQQLMKDSGIVSKISTTELKFMENEFKGRVRKNYGVHCENPSLDKYEQVMGFPVTDRNMETLKMKVMPEVLHDNHHTNQSKGSSQSSQTDHHEPVDAFAKLINGSKRLSKELAQAAQNGGVKKRRVSDKPSFVLIGRVDGISRQLDMSHEDALQWKENQVVVEMKSRVRGISSPPPLYEQIQLVAYMIMLGCSCGDLVQSVAKRREPEVVTINETVCTEVCVTSIDSAGKEVTMCAQECDSVSVSTHADCIKEEEVESSAEICSGATSIESVGTQCSALEPPSISNTASTVDTDSNIVEIEEDGMELGDYLGDVTTTTTHRNKSTTLVSSSSTVRTHTKTNAPVVATIDISTTCASVDVTTSITTSTTTGMNSTNYPRTHTTTNNCKPKPRRHDPSIMYGDEEFQVNRIQLDGPPYYHRKYWDNVVMPRLRLFRDAVAVFRSDDSIRYAYLMSGPEEKLKMLQNFCPYFEV